MPVVSDSLEDDVDSLADVSSVADAAVEAAAATGAGSVVVAGAADTEESLLAAASARKVFLALARASFLSSFSFASFSSFLRTQHHVSTTTEEQ